METLHLRHQPYNFGHLNSKVTVQATEVTTSEMFEKIHDLVIRNRRVKVREITETMDIPIKRVQNILQTQFDMKELSAR